MDNKPYYEMNEGTKNIIFELIEKCKDLNIGNINFQYFYTKENPYEVFFYITEYSSYWELVIKKESSNDIYKIVDGIMEYQFSEKD